MSVRFRKYGGFYAAGGIVCLWLKYRFGHAGSEELLWLLAPVARWVQCLSGLAFVYEQGVGYVAHSVRFIIAPSCSGVQFLLIAMAVLLFPFVHRTGTSRRGVLWFLFSLSGAYGYTIFVNGVRIMLAVWIPKVAEQWGIHPEWLTWERLHTIIGVMVYFAAILVLYRSADVFMCRLEGRSTGAEGTEVQRETDQGMRKYVIPAFWYLFVVLGVPFLNRAMDKDPAGYMEYTFVIGSVCLGIFAVMGLFRFVFCGRQKQNSSSHVPSGCPAQAEK